MSPQIDAILQQIGQLEEADRLVLSQKLQELEENAWQQEAANARTAAASKGIDQQAIDDAVGDIRYGS